MDFGVAGGASTAGSSFRNFCSRTNVHLFTMIHVRQRKRSSCVSRTGSSGSLHDLLGWMEVCLCEGFRMPALH